MRKVSSSSLLVSCMLKVENDGEAQPVMVWKVNTVHSHLTAAKLRLSYDYKR